MKSLSAVIQYGNNKFRFDVIHTKRKTLEIAVHPDSSIIIKAPLGIELTDIKQVIRKRAGWINKQIKYFRRFEPRTPDRYYMSGETHLYLGRRYRLKVCEGQKNEVKLYRGILSVHCKDGTDSGKVKNILDDWYKERAKLKFCERLDICFSDLTGMNYKRPRLNIRGMKTRWGSISPKGTITLNTDLIKAPAECIDYVITHELCHLEYKKHGPDFYKLLERMMPDWEKRKHKLEVMLA